MFVLTSKNLKFRKKRSKYFKEKKSVANYFRFQIQIFFRLALIHAFLFVRKNLEFCFSPCVIDWEPHRVLAGCSPACRLCPSPCLSSSPESQKQGENFHIYLGILAKRNLKARRFSLNIADFCRLLFCQPVKGQIYKNKWHFKFFYILHPTSGIYIF